MSPEQSDSLNEPLPPAQPAHRKAPARAASTLDGMELGDVLTVARSAQGWFVYLHSPATGIRTVSAGADRPKIE